MHPASETSPACAPVKVHSPAPQPISSDALQDVRRKDEAVSALSHAQREAAIVNAGREMEAHMRAYGETGDLGERGAADRARLRMEALIRGRSDAQVERMERERGIA